MMHDLKVAVHDLAPMFGVVALIAIGLIAVGDVVNRLQWDHTSPRLVSAEFGSVRWSAGRPYAQYQYTADYDGRGTTQSVRTISKNIFGGTYRSTFYLVSGAQVQECRYGFFGRYCASLSHLPEPAKRIKEKGERLLAELRPRSGISGRLAG